MAFLHSERPATISNRTLMFEERVSYQRTIEDVYWRHRIWPKENAYPKPSIDAVMSQVQIEKKVTDYLRKSQVLEDYWQRPITAEQLQAEMDRMAKHTKQPEVLRELFEALGNDPFVIAECLARPALAERLLTNWYSYDQRIHGELKQRAEADLQTDNSIEAMRETNGKYSETEFARNDCARNESNRNAEHSVKLNSDWDAVVQKLAETFSSSRSNQLNAQPCSHGAVSPYSQGQTVQNASAQRGGYSNSPQTKNADVQAYDAIPAGKLSTLQEDDGRYYAVAVVGKASDHLRLATVSWFKEPFELWLARVKIEPPRGMAVPSGDYRLPKIVEGGCIDDTWTATAGPPGNRYSHTAVWTGSEMIVWGGQYGQGITTVFLDTGGRYTPGTDTWADTSGINAPVARSLHTAVWTGSEMIVWGGIDESLNDLNTGGRYNPDTDSWTAMSSINAPSPRESHTAVWSGSEMIVWGGGDSFGVLNTGGNYDPNTDSWTATATTNAPEGRRVHTAVWTGSEMVAWGGVNGNFSLLNTGGKYDPGTNTWTATDTTGAPTRRCLHTAVWTGSEMIAWGGIDETGFDVNTGGRYDPSSDSWIATSTTNAPDGREKHIAVWTGSEMILWGGFDGSGDSNTGGRYDPSTNSWTATAVMNSPDARDSHTAVWSGSEMIVWGGLNTGGYLNTGGRYNPDANSWTNTGTNNAPSKRVAFTAVWSGTEMIIWGGAGDLNELNSGGALVSGSACPQDDGKRIRRRPKY